MSDVDFLIGVSDLTRQGALRFHTSRDGPYLAPDLTVPKMVELPRLLHAADTVTHDGGDDLAAIRTLLEAGSGSLGGARPKASVRDGDRLLIAKFLSTATSGTCWPGRRRRWTSRTGQALTCREANW